jgi:hypothetical protein
MSAPSQLTYSLNTTRTFIGVGATLALFVDVQPGQIATTVKYMNGGTLEILPPTLGMSFVPGVSTVNQGIFLGGSTQSLAMLAALSGTGYLMGSSEVLSFNGPTRFYLSALGATTLVCVIRHFGAGF